MRISITLLAVCAGAAYGEIAERIVPKSPEMVVSERRSAPRAAPAGLIRCGGRDELLVGVAFALAPAVWSNLGPESAVWVMFAGLQRRQEGQFVSQMTEDFRFDSDDPEFRAVFPFGMTREDERAFSSHLLHGGKLGPDGQPLPIATGVDTLMRPMASVTIESSGTKARVVLDRVHVRFKMSDGTVFELSEARNEMELVWAAESWKVRRWREMRFPAPADEPQGPVAKADRDSTSGRSGRDSLQSDLALPTRLDLTAYADRGRNALVFRLALPHGGGVLELFDVMGRRVTQRDLSDLRAGRHTVMLEGARYPSGVYWARVRQRDATATSKLVWAR